MHWFEDWNVVVIGITDPLDLHLRNPMDFKTKKYSKEHYGKRHKKGQSCDGGKGGQDKRFPHER